MISGGVTAAGASNQRLVLQPWIHWPVRTSQPEGPDAPGERLRSHRPNKTGSRPVWVLAGTAAVVNGCRWMPPRYEAKSDDRSRRRRWTVASSQLASVPERVEIRGRIDPAYRSIVNATTAVANATI
jgi:hypothetical protein